MASSTQYQLAQTPKPCELCELESNTRFKCIECNKFMCDKCKEIHTKVPSLSNHQVLDIKIATNLHTLQQKIHVDCLPCKNHNNKFHCLYCKLCDQLVCPDCISSLHVKHDFEPIDKACERKLEELKLYDSRIGDEITKLGKRKRNLQQVKTQWELDTSETLRCVDANELEIKEAVTKYASQVRRRVETERTKRNDLIDKYQLHVTDSEAKLETYKCMARSSIESNQGEVIFNTAADLSKIKMKIDNSQIPTATINLSPTKISTEVMEKIFGSLNQVEMQSCVDVEIVSNTASNIPGIDKIVMCSDGNSWIACGTETSYLIKTKLNKKSSRHKTIDLDAFDMAVRADNTLLVSVHMTSEVKRVNENGKIEPFIDVAPLIARGIHVSKDEEIILGVRDQGNPYEITDQSCRQIIVFGADGKRKRSYEFDSNNQRLTTIPRRVCTDINGNIIINDSIAADKGRIVALGHRGEIRWICDGQSREKPEKRQFDPDDMVSTSTGYIILSDERAHSLYVISIVGEILLQKDLRKVGIVVPRAIAVDSDGILWVGCPTHRLKQDTLNLLKKKHTQIPDLCCLKLIASYN